jgi:hypothetical protein
MRKYFMSGWFYERDIHQCEYCEKQKPVTLFAGEIICRKCIKEQYDY